MIAQAWLQVAGLVLDFLGFALIAAEWILAQRQERAALAIEAAQARQAESMAYLQRASTGMSPHAASSSQRHFEMMADSQRRMADQRLGSVRQYYGGLRSGVVYAGMAMVCLGFILQLLGNWPGCCRLIGIMPGN